MSEKSIKNFFISYAQSDKVWAEWIAWVLEEAGYSVVIKAWDFTAGKNLAIEMDEATKNAERTIAILSPKYLESGFSQAEWAGAFVQDPTGEKGILLPVRVARCDLDGLLGMVVYIDLVDLDSVSAEKALLAAVSSGRAKPSTKPLFPGHEKPVFPPDQLIDSCIDSIKSKGPINLYMGLFLMCLVGITAVVRVVLKEGSDRDTELQVGDKFQDCSNCPVMTIVPDGSFKMGSIDGPKNENPLRTVNVSSRFAIGVVEITFAEFDYYLQSTNQKNSPNDEGWGRKNRPVINVTWDDAKAYTSWLSEKSDSEYGLPTEAEWEYAATSGGKRKKYPWVEKADGVMANCDGCGSNWDNVKTAQVKRFSGNLFGLYDVAGNVSEWVEDCWHENYQNAPRNSLAWLEDNDGDCSLRVHRGGSWRDKKEKLRNSWRGRVSHNLKKNHIGFRVVKILR